MKTLLFGAPWLMLAACCNAPAQGSATSAGATSSSSGTTGQGTTSGGGSTSGGASTGGSSSGGGTTTGTSDAGPCPAEMALIAASDGGLCIDRYEAAVVLVLPDGGETPWDPLAEVRGDPVRAVVARGVLPQAYINQTDAVAACQRSGKRLCGASEWLTACQGLGGDTYPYGNAHVAGTCNDTRGTPPMVDCFGSDATAWTAADFVSPCCDQQANTVVAGGTFADCTTPEGVHDLDGNLIEWVVDPDAPLGASLRGGDFVNAQINGPGCLYRTTAHAGSYRDYTTGFRCCADPR